MNFNNPHYGDWSAFDTGEVHLTRGRTVPVWVDVEYRNRERLNEVTLTNICENGFRGFETDRITHEAMSAYARNVCYRPRIRKLPREVDVPTVASVASGAI